MTVRCVWVRQPGRGEELLEHEDEGAEQRQARAEHIAREARGGDAAVRRNVEGDVERELAWLGFGLGLGLEGQGQGWSWGWGWGWVGVERELAGRGAEVAELSRQRRDGLVRSRTGLGYRAGAGLGLG